MADVISDLGFLFLGSRLKRLAERLQADAAKVHHALGVQAQPAELALLAALDRVGPMSNAEAVTALGVSQPGVTRTAAGTRVAESAAVLPRSVIRRIRDLIADAESTGTAPEDVINVLRVIWPSDPSQIRSSDAGDPPTH